MMRILGAAVAGGVVYAGLLLLGLVPFWVALASAGVAALAVVAAWSDDA